MSKLAIRQPHRGLAGVPQPAPYPRLVPAPRGSDLEHLSDEQLLALVLAGRRGAWRVFSQRFEGMMFSLAARVSTQVAFPLPTEELADVVQEIRVRMVEHDYRRLRVFRPDRGTKLSSWIGLIASSATRDYVRRVRRHRIESWSIEEFDGLPAAEADPEQRLLAAEVSNELRAALRSLSPRDREFAERCFIEEQRAEEIANAMQISIGTSYGKKCKITERLVTLLRASSPG